MDDNRALENQELLREFLQAVEEWENSPYYLPREEVLDLERFLTDHHATDLRTELESLYGVPLNQRFWSSFLAYHRLKRTREEIKAQEALQDEKRRLYLQAMEEEKKDRREWARELLYHQRRQQIKVLPGGKKDKD